MNRTSLTVPVRLSKVVGRISGHLVVLVVSFHKLAPASIYVQMK
jgi:hypothetical protein